MKGKKENQDGRETPHSGDAAADSVAVASANAEGSPTGVEVEPSSSDDSVAPTAAEWQAKVEKLENALLRARADFQNLQRRADAERLDAIRYANAELMKSLVKSLDDLERALASTAQTENLTTFAEGMKLVYENLSKSLSEHGLETIEALHKAFDPTIHEALLNQPTAEHPPGTVIEQVAKGYRLRGRVVRPAKVIVAKMPEGGSA